MFFKGVDFFPHGTKWKIIDKRYIFVGLSWALAILAAALLLTRGLNFGVDFKGGSLIEVQSKSGPLDVARMRDKLNGLGLGEVQVQGVGTSGTEALIRIAEQKDEKVQADAGNKVTAAIGDTVNVRRTEIVGPSVSNELKWTGIKAVVVAMLGILAYVWFRFEWQFAVGAVLALTHDVLVVMGIFAFFQFEFDLSTVAALLTILGYSVNDTVVVSDRIRENLRKFKKMELNELLNLSINETLSRTILTGVTAIVVLVALYIFGGEVIRNFNFAMLLGVLIGTYSSIFIAAPLLGYLGVKRDWSETQAKGNAPARA